MRRFSLPTRYARYVEGAIAVALADVGRDASCRDDEDPRVRALAKVPDHLMSDEPGRTVVLMLTEAESVLILEHRYKVWVTRNSLDGTAAGCSGAVSPSG